MNWDANKDGVDHVNIYSKGKTTLGRFMSNFEPVNDLFLDEGWVFASIEAYWYWLSLPTHIRTSPTRMQDLNLLSGYAAKKVGKELQAIHGKVHVPDFEDKIKKAIRLKFERNPRMRNMLARETKPLTHYYVFTSKNSNQSKVVDAGHAWMLRFFEELRMEFQGVDPNAYVFPPDDAFTPIELPVPCC